MVSGLRGFIHAALREPPCPAWQYSLPLFCEFKVQEVLASLSEVKQVKANICPLAWEAEMSASAP